MSNSSSNSIDTISAFSSSYFEWLESDVLPYISGVSFIIILITGIILNSLSIQAIRKKRITYIGGNILFVQLLILDFVAYAMIIVPAFCAAFSKISSFPDEFCLINGAVVNLCFLCTFVFLTLLCVERSIKLFNPKLHSKTFSNKCISTGLCIITWAFALIGSFLPATGWGVIEYLAHQYRCNLSHSKNKLVMNLTFIFGLYGPVIVSLTFCIIAIGKRSEFLRSLISLEKEVTKINNIMRKKIRRNNSASMKGLEESYTMTDIIDKPFTGDKSQFDLHPHSGNRIFPGDFGESETSRSDIKMRNDMIEQGSKTDRKSLNTSKVAVCVYNSSSEQYDFHLAATYMLMWIVIVGLWLPYIILCYLKAYKVVNVWDGWFTFAILLSDVGYCIKPIIFLSHNRLFRTGAIKTVPESLRNRATRARRLLRKTARKMDKMVFVNIKDDKEGNI